MVPHLAVCTRPSVPRACFATNAGKGRRCLRRTLPVKSAHQPLEADPAPQGTPRSSEVVQQRRGLLLASASLTASLCNPLHGPPGVPEASAKELPEVTDLVFLDVSVNGESLGRIEIGLYGKASPAAVDRFKTIMGGPNGQSYRNSKFSTIRSDLGFIRNAGLKSLRLGNSDLELQGAGPLTIQCVGTSQRALLSELAENGGLSHTVRDLHDSLPCECGRMWGSESSYQYQCSLGPAMFVAMPTSIQSKGDVSLYLRNLQEGEQKLVVGKGKVQMVTKGAPQPNGSGFNIALGGSASDVLDPTSIVVGRVVQGLDVVDQIASVPATKDNSDSPFLKVGLAIGDARAKSAQAAFGMIWNVKPAHVQPLPPCGHLC
eukprot:scaffold3296_cov405-Prasinococcus_capsulatus_cf.AAC.3